MKIWSNRRRILEANKGVPTIEKTTRSPLVDFYKMKEKELDLNDDTPLEVSCDKDDPTDCESCQ